MSAPEVAPSTEDLYASLGAYTSEDERLGYPLLRWIDAGCRVFVEPVAELVSERDGYVPWEVLFDPDGCPVAQLPYLAQYVGADLPAELTEAEKRARIRLPEVWSRGSLPALVAAVQRTLDPASSKVVLVTKRYGGSAWRMYVRTLLSQTPDEARTRAAVMAHKPRGYLGPTDADSIYAAVTSGDYDDLATRADYDALAIEFTDYDEMAAAPPV